jgi:hypothetical protein
VILGGTGRIGTAVAIHLLRRDENCHVVLVGRRPRPEAVQEVLEEASSSKYVAANTKDRVSFCQLKTVWEESLEFQQLVDSCDCLIHTAGPYLDQTPVPLQLAIKSPRCHAYVDVSDPLPYLEDSLRLSQEAQSSNLTALVAAGAFPGMSNVLAKEAASALLVSGTNNNTTDVVVVEDVRFHYFTAGLGGSGVVNLYITNLGFGEPMVQYDQGALRRYPELSGSLLGKIDFFLPHLRDHVGNKKVQQRVGSQTVFAWPFPEAATVAENVKANGNSYAAMGTAPDLWNVMLGVLVQIVPRAFWKNARFSKFMADFSQPLVLATDAWLKQTSVGETHAMRIDVTSSSSSKVAAADAAGSSREEEEESSSYQHQGVSIVQAHDSFRECVGQSCAEFALDLLSEHHSTRPGVYLPEQFYEDSQDRSRILEKLTTTPGTFCYTGPVLSERAPDLPSDWDKAVLEANEKEEASEIIANR